jgi:hypothetical protein
MRVGEGECGGRRGAVREVYWEFDVRKSKLINSAYIQKTRAQ